MRRILYIDYIFLFGHVNFDKIQINALRRTGAAVKLVMHEAFAARLGFPAQDYELVIPARLNPPAGASPLLNRIYFLRTLLYIRRHVDFRAWDAVVFSTFDEVTMSLVPLCRRKLLFCHGNVTTLGITAKRLLMKLIGRHNYFLVFNDYMRRKCLATGLSRTMVVSHGCVKPYRMDRAAERLPFDKSRYSMVIFHPSASPNVEFFRSLTSDRGFCDFLMRENILLVLHTDTALGSACPNIMEIKGYMEGDEYKALFLTSDIILIAYPASFCYRVSGVSYECVANGKRALILSSDAFNYCRDYYNYDPMFADARALEEKILYLRSHDEARCTASPASLEPDYTEILARVAKDRG